MASRPKVHASVAQSLVHHGLRRVFGLLGDGNLALIDGLVRNHGVAYVAANREDGAVMMADGYARVTGEVGFASVTHGPGLTNAVTPLHEAARARTPLVLLCGDSPATHPPHNQDIDQRATVLPTGAAFRQLRGPSTTGQDVAIAIRQARVERRPVVLNLPAELQAQDAEHAEIVPYTATIAHALAPDADALDRALGIVASSQRPLVLAGRGAVDASARAAILRLAEQLRAPVATTLKARGWFAGESYDLGVCGTVAFTPALETIADADCIIAFGASLNRYTTSTGALLDGRRVIQVDTDPEAIGRWYPVDAGVLGDAGLVATAMADSLAELGGTPPGLRSPQLLERLARHTPQDEFEDRSDDTRIDPSTLMTWLDRTLPADRALTVDCGGYMAPPLRYLGTASPHDHVLPATFGAVGLGVGAAIGAAFARPERPVLSIIGDGGFMLGGIIEFDTAVRHRLDVIVVVLDNGGYGIEYRNLETIGGDPTLADMNWPDAAGVARSLGGEGITIRCRADLPAAAAAIAARRGPLVIRAMIGAL